MVMKIGMIGLNKGNGHPFSFSAIINGYESEAMLASGWKVIHDYLHVRDASEFGFENIQVTHAWTQDIEMTKLLCQACRIPYAVQEMTDMLPEVEAVIIARDDYEQHINMALPFLKRGLPVFVDKPLSLKVKELKQLKPYLQSGQLMSCSAMRYAQELDDIRQGIPGYGELSLIRGIGVNGWETYGIHLLEAILSLVPTAPKSVTALEAKHSSMAITMENGTLVQIDTLADHHLPATTPIPFQIDFWGATRNISVQIKDHFSMFRRMLWHFIHSIKSGSPAITPASTLTLMRLLIAGQLSKSEKRKVFIHEISI